MGEPNRFKILSLLHKELVLCVSDVAKRVDLSVANTSHHLQVMEEEGLVSCEPDGRCRLYRIVHPLVGDILQRATTPSRLHLPDTFPKGGGSIPSPYRGRDGT